MVGGLSGGGVSLGGVSDDAEGWLIGHDLDALDGVGVAWLHESVLVEELHNSLDGACGLMLIESKLEVHAHDREVITFHAQIDVEGTVSLGGFIESEDCLRVSEDILGADKAFHGSSHAEDGCLSADGCGGSLAVGQLLAGSDGSEGDVVGAEHTDGMLDLLRGGSQHGPIGGGAGNGSMDHVVNLVGLQTEGLAESASDLIDEDHSLGDLVASDESVLLGS